MSYMNNGIGQIKAMFSAGSQMVLHSIQYAARIRSSPQNVEDVSIAAYHALEALCVWEILGKSCQPLSNVLKCMRVFTLFNSVKSICEKNNQLLQLCNQPNLSANIKFIISQVGLCSNEQLLSGISKTIWTSVEFGIIVLYAKEWNIIDTAAIAQSIGSWSILKYANTSDFSKIVTGAVVVGFFTDTIIACLEFYKCNTTEKELLGTAEKEYHLSNLRWKVVSKTCLTVYYGAYFYMYNSNPLSSGYLHLAGCLSRSISVIYHLNEQSLKRMISTSTSTSISA